MATGWVMILNKINVQLLCEGSDDHGLGDACCESKISRLNQEILDLSLNIKFSILNFWNFWTAAFALLAGVMSKEIGIIFS
jgi:hypothetical protein